MHNACCRALLYRVQEKTRNRLGECCKGSGNSPTASLLGADALQMGFVLGSFLHSYVYQLYRQLSRKTTAFFQFHEICLCGTQNYSLPLHISQLLLLPLFFSSTSLWIKVKALSAVKKMAMRCLKKAEEPICSIILPRRYKVSKMMRIRFSFLFGQAHFELSFQR